MTEPTGSDSRGDSAAGRGWPVAVLGTIALVCPVVVAVLAAVDDLPAGPGASRVPSGAGSGVGRYLISVWLCVAAIASGLGAIALWVRASPGWGRVLTVVAGCFGVLGGAALLLLLTGLCGSSVFGGECRP